MCLTKKNLSLIREQFSFWQVKTLKPQKFFTKLLNNSKILIFSVSIVPQLAYNLNYYEYFVI